MEKMLEKTKRAIVIAQLAYFGLLSSVALNILWLNRENIVSPKLSLLIWWLPLLLPLIGIIRRNPYTYAWANFISAIYICRSLTNFYLSPEQWPHDAVELCFASAWFIAGSFFARWRGIELGLELKKS